MSPLRGNHAGEAAERGRSAHRAAGISSDTGGCEPGCHGDAYTVTRTAWLVRETVWIETRSDDVCLIEPVAEPVHRRHLRDDDDTGGLELRDDRRIARRNRCAEGLEARRVGMPATSMRSFRTMGMP